MIAQRREFYQACDRIAAAIDSLPAAMQPGTFRHLAGILNVYARYTAEAAVLHRQKQPGTEPNRP
jgi:hypothetical protein